jgi:transposase
MAGAISNDIRKRVVEAYRAGRGTYRELAELFGVGEASVNRWLRLERENSDIRPAPHAGGMPPRVPKDEYGTLAKLVAEKPDRTVVEIRDEWRRRFGVDMSRSAMQRALLKAGFTWKKNAFVRRSKTVRKSRRVASSSAQR